MTIQNPIKFIILIFLHFSFTIHGISVCTSTETAFLETKKKTNSISTLNIAIERTQLKHLYLVDI